MGRIRPVWKRAKDRLRAPMWLRGSVRDLLDLIHPLACLSCDSPLRLVAPTGPPPPTPVVAPGVPLCPACRRAFPLVSAPCRRCSWSGAGEHAAPAPAERPRQDSPPRTGVPVLTAGCPLCRHQPPPFPLRHAGWYEGELREAVLAAKWHARQEWIPVLAAWTAEAASRTQGTAGLDGWVAVPRSPFRRLLHGPGLAEPLASEIGRRLGLPRWGRLRKRGRDPQSRLTAVQRRHSPEGAFRLRGRGGRGGSVLLVDDVYTTGSTVEQAGKALLRGGAHEIRLLVVAVTPP